MNSGLEASPASSALPRDRLAYLDWLRIFTILFVFLTHVSMPFQIVPRVWYIQYTQTHVAFTLIPAFTYQWAMPLFFFLAGAGAQLSLSVRSPRRYITERVQRLLLPLIFGSLAFIPFQQYLSQKSQALQPASFLAYYPAYFTGCFTRPGLGILRIDCSTGHLWFLAYLLIYSILTLPVLVWLMGKHGLKWISSLANWCAKPWMIWLLFLPTALVQIGLRARFPQHQNWNDFFFWAIYFCYGFIFLSDRRFLGVLERSYRFSLAVAGVSFIAILLLLGPGGQAGPWEFHPTLTLSYALYQVLRSLETWGWVIGFMGLGIMYWNTSSRLLRYSREALLPFYILHHPTIIALAYALIPWVPPILIRFLVLTGGSLLLTLGVYELVVRRFTWMSVLFGMKIKSEKSTLSQMNPATFSRR